VSESAIPDGPEPPPTPDAVAPGPNVLDPHPVGPLELKGMGVLEGVCDAQVSDEIRRRFV